MSTEIHKCCRMLWRRGFHLIPCRNKAKAQYEGKWYCGIHDPMRRKAKRAAREANRKPEDDDE